MPLDANAEEPQRAQRNRVRALYERRAAAFDRVSALYRLFGVRLDHYRRQAVEAMALRPGATAADLGCGTGLALRYLVEKVGPRGAVLGVDFSPAMRERARRRAARARWSNVELVAADLAEWWPPRPIGGALSVLALALVPDVDPVVERVAAGLVPGGRFVVVDLRQPSRVPRSLVELGIRINRGYGVDRALLARDWPAALGRRLRVAERRRFYAGGVELVVAEKPA